MIQAHQPTIFGSAVTAALSSKSDGNLRFGTGDNTEIQKNRQAFLRSAGIDPRRTNLVRITFDAAHYTRYRIIDTADNHKGIMEPEEVVPADALVTDQPAQALFLLLADCVGAILYDPKHRVLMVSHLGRHSVEEQGAKKSVEYLHRHFGTESRDIKVWLSPAVGNASYPLRKFGNKSLHDVISRELLEIGVPAKNIECGDIDTATNREYYSHSEFLKGNQPGPARFAIVAMMRAQGEPAA